MRKKYVTYQLFENEIGFLFVANQKDYLIKVVNICKINVKPG